MILSKQTKAEYLRNPGCCPFCGSEDIDSTPSRDNDANDYYYLNTYCVNCSGSWVDEYKLHDISDVEPGNTMPPGTVELLALSFSEHLTIALTGGQMMKVIELNAGEQDPHICHSHDFCDANMIMNQAFNQVMGRDACPAVEPDEEDEDYRKQQDSDLSLWNEAWYMAKAGRFYYSYLIDPLPIPMPHTFR